MRFAVSLVLICISWFAGLAPLIAAEAEAKTAPVAAAPAATTANPPTAQTPTQPGHSLHGEAFDEGPRQKAYLMGTTGDVHFPITTKNPLAQQFFDQGLGQLHGFWYFEAERSFRQVVTLDPHCAMAYWGMAMANVNNEKRAKSLIERATEKETGTSPREAAWIDAFAAYYTAPESADQRRKLVRDLETLVQNYPNDIEAKAFLALQIWKNGSWMTEDKKNRIPISSHQAVDALLDQVFQVQPMHPAHHYRIHLWDDEKPARALVSASLNGQSAPGIAHMWHMPGHTYSKLQRYADAAWQQEASARVDHAHMMRDRVLPSQIFNYPHNNEWLIRNLAYLGRVAEAIDLASNMIKLPRHPKFNLLENKDKKESAASFGRTRLFDVLVQFERWQEIITYSTTNLEPLANNLDDQLRRSRALGLAWFGLSKADEGNKQIAALEELLKEKRAARYAAADEAEAEARKEKKTEAEVTKAMADALAAHSDSLKNIETVLADLRGHAAMAVNNLVQARAEFDKIKDSPLIRNDYLAHVFSLCGDPTQAEPLARKAVEKGTNEVYPLAVLVEVLHRSGKQPEARAEFEKLRSVAAYADLDLSVFERLKPLAQKLNLPADWRYPRQAAPDVGQRPELNSLGPFRWQPTAAESWSLPSPDGKTLALENYRGKPVVVIFYLGSGCLHCVEQLHTFAPLYSQYTAAGIAIVAISTESLDSLKASLTTLSAKEAIPFPLAADADLNVFKAYRAYDDFENMPLHGTFLIDGQGLVRWHDIGFEPFSDAQFVLDEAKRLLRP